jgi:hypothetical protein
VTKEGNIDDPTDSSSVFEIEIVLLVLVRMIAMVLIEDESWMKELEVESVDEEDEDEVVGGKGKLIYVELVRSVVKREELEMPY